MGHEEVEVFFHNDIINSCSKHSRKEGFEDQGTMTFEVTSKIKYTPVKTHANNAWPSPQADYQENYSHSIPFKHTKHYHYPPNMKKASLASFAKNVDTLRIKRTPPQKNRYR